MLIAIAGTALLLIVFAFQSDEIINFSSWELIFISLVGLLVATKFKLVGGGLLTFSGTALVVHTLMFTSTYWLLPGALLTGIAGLIILINWWRQNGK